MNRVSHNTTVIASALALLAAAILALVPTASATPAQPLWRIDSLANTTAVPGGTLTYHVEPVNTGLADTVGPVTTTIDLPPHVTAVSSEGVQAEEQLPACTDALGGPLAGATTIKCTTTNPVFAPIDSPAAATLKYVIVTQVGEALIPPQTLTATMRVEGGGAPAPASTIDPTRIGGLPSFGIDAFDAQVSSDAGGDPAAAATHPYADTTSLDFNTFHNPLPLRGDFWPAAPVKDALVDLPPGLLGGTSGVDQCTVAQLANGGSFSPKPVCRPSSQVGTVLARTNGFPLASDAFGPLPVFNMVPPPDAPAQFGFDFSGTIVTLTARLRSAGDYGISVDGRDISEGLPVTGTSLTFWGVPSDPSHEADRACPGKPSPSKGGPSCASEAPAKPFFRNPTACTAHPDEGLPTTLHIDSWEHPGMLDENGEPVEEAAWQSATSRSHEAPGYPFPTEPSTFPAGYSGPEEQGEEVGITGCEEVPFTPTISAQPTTNTADSPAGLDVHLTVPQECWEAKEPAEGEEESETIEKIEEEVCQSDLKDAEVTLPQGMSVNPASANGLGACTPEQIGLMTETGVTPAHFNEKPAACPDSSKIGKVEIETPLIEEHLTGAVYLASQSDNPFNSLLAIYMVAEGAGVVVKQAGEIKIGANGQLTTVFTNAPQTPFSDLHLELFGGQHAALRTPSACGTYTTTAKLTPWSHEGTEGEGGTPIAEPSSSFQVTGCGGGFAPKLDAGSTNPLAGAFSPFVLRLTREDGSQELAGLSAKLPEGLLAKLAGIPYCPDSALASLPKEANGEALLGSGRSQEASPSCPAASLVGKVTVGAGAGTNPFYTEAGRAYLAGPYKGAPLSLAVIAPAVAGPFDLGSVLVRNALRIDPETAQASAVSDPFPTILHGIPLDLRDIRVELNRPSFTLNPTSCNPMSVDAAVSSTQGASANLSSRFQVAGCDKLAFKPKLSLRLKGKTSRRAHPAIKAVLTMPPSNQANIARAQVTLPHAEFLDQGHIRNVCTQVQFKGAGCPASSILGHATAYSPLLDNPLSGPVYLMSGFGHKLPDLAADLNGQIRVLLHGKVDTGPGGGIRNTFEVVPDAPVTKFTLSLKGGSRGLIQNSEDVCAHPGHAVALFDGHNGRTHDLNPLIKTDCGAKPHGKRHRGGKR